MLQGPAMSLVDDPAIMPFLDVAKMSLAADGSKQAPQVVGETSGQGNAQKNQTSRNSPGKPVREKVSSKDLQQFEIDVSAIENGQDERTTVMLRNMPKACSREDFLKLLGQSGLGDRITFLYMPFDKRRNVHCGFAFVNFSTPEDVLKMVRSIQAGLLKGTVARNMSMPPAISYARLQGHDELVRHFSLSAVMYDDDARKRPLFVPGSKGAAKAERNGKNGTKITNRADVDASNMLPVYITLEGNSSTCQNGGFSSSGSEGGAHGAGPVAGA
jgi:RNA recognition motif-containing protein